ncbi:MAG: RluA family pseudouridine synthase [Myxococcales bacterium]|nr:RluA family pseudouridine synthase [Myxococcales bacterium]
MSEDAYQRSGEVHSAADLELVYEDDELVAINKPAWSVVHYTRGVRGALLLNNALAERTGAKVFPLHRLDRQTSGVIVFAKSSEVASLMSADVRDGIWHKRYLGLARGTIEAPLTCDRGVKEGDVRRDARSDFEPLESFCDRYTLVRATPHTGRRHQLRYHLKHISHPIVGDVLYGDSKVNRFFRETFGLGRHFLHAAWLRVLRPGRAEALELEAPLPPELEDVLEKLRAYDGPVV